MTDREIEVLTSREFENVLGNWIRTKSSKFGVK